eukprot:3116630-Karenia_brevis.AAC.1
MIRDHKIHAFLTHTDPENVNHTGGVGTLFRPKVKCMKLRPNTEGFLAAQSTGRVQLVAVMLPGNITLIIANIYCWTNGHTNQIAADRTNSLMSVIFEELQTHPRSPKIILGDLNADTDDIIALQQRLDDSEYIDLGNSMAHNEGNVAMTCFSPNNTHPTRRDF